MIEILWKEVGAANSAVSTPSQHPRQQPWVGRSATILPEVHHSSICKVSQGMVFSNFLDKTAGILQELRKSGGPPFATAKLLLNLPPFFGTIRTKT